MNDTFAVRRTLKGAVLFLAASLVVVLFGAVLLVGADPVGAWVLGFGLLLAALLLLQSARPGWRYRVLPEGIEVHRAFGATLVPASAVAAVENVDARAVEDALAGPQGASLAAGRRMDFRSGMEARRALSRILLFVTVPVVLSQVTRPTLERQARAKTSGRFALVRLTDGTVRALSPVDVDGFVAACGAAGIIHARPAGAAAGTGPVTPGGPGTPAGPGSAGTEPAARGPASAD
jgi:hypothetical protein